MHGSFDVDENMLIYMSRGNNDFVWESPKLPAATKKTSTTAHKYFYYCREDSLQLHAYCPNAAPADCFKCCTIVFDGMEQASISTCMETLFNEC